MVHQSLGGENEAPDRKSTTTTPVKESVANLAVTPPDKSQRHFSLRELHLNNTFQKAQLAGYWRTVVLDAIVEYSVTN